MLAPGLIALISPILVGFLGGTQMLIGLLTGVTITGVGLAIFMSNAGGAWDNAKKMAEADEGGRNSEAYKAAVVGDTVGIPSRTPPDRPPFIDQTHVHGGAGDRAHAKSLLGVNTIEQRISATSLHDLLSELRPGPVSAGAG